MNNASLKHYGILGMKWGVRTRSERGSSDHKRASSLKRKRLSDLSNEELKHLTTRMNLEQQYKNLKKGPLDAGQKWVSDLLRDSSKEVAKGYATKALGKGVDQLIAKWPRKK